MSSLASLVVHIQSNEPVALPKQVGRASLALFLRWVAAHDAALAQRLHDSNEQKPFTCSSVVGIGRLRQGQAEAGTWLRLSALNNETAEVLQRVALLPPKTLELDEQLLQVQNVTLDAHQHTWAGTNSYEALSAPYLLATNTPERTLRLAFSSPTTFNQAGKNQPLPLPELVFGSLADKWNSFSSIAISPELREYARLAVVLNRFRLKSRALRTKDGGVTLGCVGIAEYKALRYDRYWQSMLCLLADYALYAGVGRMTTQGMGQARRLLEA